MHQLFWSTHFFAREKRKQKLSAPHLPNNWLPLQVSPLPLSPFPSCYFSLSSTNVHIHHSGTKLQFPFKLHFQDPLCSWHSLTTYYETKIPSTTLDSYEEKEDDDREFDPFRSIVLWATFACIEEEKSASESVPWRRQGIPKDVSLWFCNSFFTRVTPKVMLAIRLFWRQSFHW